LGIGTIAENTKFAIHPRSFLLTNTQYPIFQYPVPNPQYPRRGAERARRKKMSESSGVIEVDMFSEDVDSPDHDQAVQFKKMLEAVAEAYDCRLLHFEIDHGTVSFSFDSDDLMARILKILRDDGQVQS